MSLILLLAMTSLAAPPEVRYAITVETKTWQPIELADVQRIVENAAVTPLTQRGDLRLVRAPLADLAAGDYTLLVQGRFIEEAEDFSLYMTFGPGRQTNLPSFYVSGHHTLGKRPRLEMQRLMEELGKELGARLDALLAPNLAHARAGVSAEPPPLSELAPWSWSDMELPKVPSPKALLRTLIDPRSHDHDRMRAVVSIEPAAFDEPAARAALERCVLADPSPAVRVQCARALEPSARVFVPTQRVLLSAMRNEFDSSVLRELTRISKSFAGLSRSEAIDTWLYLVASEATPGDVADEIARVLADEGDVPNLDLAVARCLALQSLAYGKKNACADILLREIPASRREAVVWHYLESTSAWELGSRMAVENVIETLGPRHRSAPSRAMCDTLAALAARPGAGAARVHAASALRYCKDPSPAVVDRLLEAAEQMEAWMAIGPLVEVSREQPALRARALAGLRALEKKLVSRACTPAPSRPKPLEEVRKAITSLERQD